MALTQSSGVVMLITAQATGTTDVLHVHTADSLVRDMHQARQYSPAERAGASTLSAPTPPFFTRSTIPDTAAERSLSSAEIERDAS